MSSAKQRRRHSPKRQPTWPAYQFRVDATREFNATQALWLTQSLLRHGTIALQIVARPEGITWQTIALSTRGIPLEALKTSEIAVRAIEWAGDTPAYVPYYQTRSTYTLAYRADHPLISIMELKDVHDPLIPLVQTLSALQDHEVVIYTLLIARPHKPLVYQGLQWLQEWDGDYSTHERYQQAVENKRRQLWYECALLVDVQSLQQARTFHLQQAIELQLTGCFTRPTTPYPSNRLERQTQSGMAVVHHLDEAYNTQAVVWYQRSQQDERIRAWWTTQWMYLTPSEIATLWHLPHETFQGTNVPWRKNRPSLSRLVAASQIGICLGTGIYQDQPRPVYLHPQDRDTHLNIIGKTGVGKSTLLHHLIHQDIAGGEGVLVIDPHGALVTQILQTSIPPEREKDVVVLDLNQPDYPLPLNVFADGLTYGAIGRVVDIIERLYDQTGVRMDKYLRAALKALTPFPQITMKDVYRLLVDDGYRQHILAQIKDTETYQTLGVEYHHLKPEQRRTIRAPILNRIAPFYTNEYLYPSLCHPQRIDLAGWITSRKIILVALGVHGEVVPQQERSLIGSLLISLLQMVGMNPQRQPVPLYVYIDEMQNFVTTALPVLFSEARKYHIHLTVAHQFLGQMPEETLRAVMGNVGTTIAFRCDALDAQLLAPYLRPIVDVTDVVGLNRFQMIVKMQHQGETQDAFWVKGNRPLLADEAGKGREKRIRALSIAQYTPLPRQTVLEWLQTRYHDLREGDDPALDYTQFMDPP